MAKGIVFLSTKVGSAHAQMATEALQDAARRNGCEVQVCTQVADAAQVALNAANGDEYERVVVAGEAIAASDAPHRERLVQTVVSALIRHPERYLPILPQPVAAPGKEQDAVPVTTQKTVRLVAITSCPTGIAHTFMAASALKKAASELGYEIRVETQGSVGAKNTLTEEEIRNCSAAIIAADTNVDASRFDNVRLYKTSTNEAIHHGKELIAKALALPAARPAADVAKPVMEKRQRTGAYKHLMTGVSHMLPLVTAGGLMIALAFAVGGIHAGDQTGSLAWALMQIGSATAFKLYIAVLSAYISFSIADRPGLCPGLVGGMLSMTLGAGFLGGIVSGFLAGYLTKLLNEKLPIPSSLEGLKPVLILPVLSTLMVGLAMIFVIGNPVRYVFDGLTYWLAGMQQGSAGVLGLLLGAMMAFDMGGPVNKAAYAFSVGLLSANVHGPMAATMAAGMTPPLGIAVAALIFRGRFSRVERNESKVASIMGLSFITEGAIPYAARDPLRAIPCFMAGSAVTGAISMVMGCGIMVPHGGAFVLLIPNAVTNLRAYVLAIVCGALLTGLLLGLVKRKPLQA